MQPSFLYQNPSFSTNSFQQLQRSEKEGSIKPRKSLNNSTRKDLKNSQIHQCEIEGDTQKKHSFNNNLHFTFDNCKMIGRTNSSYVYQLFDKENNNIQRALKLQLHPKKQQDVCVQSSHKSNPTQKCMCSMLKQEWNALKLMQHPHVLSAFNFYENLEIEPNSFCCAIEMELAECNLHQLIIKLSESKQLGLKFVKRLLHEVCIALNYFHNHVNYTHNDIKPDNIFLFFDKQQNQYYAKIADLGTARQYNQENHLCETLFENWKSRNPDYQPPEIIEFLNFIKNREFNQINPFPSFDEKKADIFNLGTLFFAVLFQLRPFSCRGATEHDPLYKYIYEGRFQEFWSQDKFSRMLNYWSQYQPEQDMINMVQLVTCMISKDPSQRPSIDSILQHPWFQQDIQQQQQNN